jgi:hypothetical protein
MVWYGMVWYALIWVGLVWLWFHHRRRDLICSIQVGSFDIGVNCWYFWMDG